MARAPLLPRLAACALAAALAACGASQDQPPSILLVTLDTTRADALGCFGGRAGVTPTFDALARESLRFEAARTVAPITLTAHATILTGLYPFRHGLRDNAVGALPDGAVTLAERAREAGYQTAGFVAAIVLDSRFGLAQGFEHFSQTERVRHEEFSPFIDHRPAEEIADEVLAWLAARDRTRPFCVWMHLYDPHYPYEPPPELLRQAGGDAYLGEVARTDRAVGRVLEALRAEGVLEHVVVALTADHGEALGEHGEGTHGNLCYDSTIRVPLLLRCPDRAHAGETRTDPVSVADLFPTLLELAHLGPAGDVDGRSLLAPPDPARGVYCESYVGFLNFGWSPITGWADSRVKFLHSGEDELYLWREDPRELADRAAEHPEELARARAALEELGRRPALQGGDKQAIDEALLVRVRSLGYAGEGGSADEIPALLAETGLPSPRSRTAEVDKVQRAFGLVEQGDKAGAIELLREVVAANPKHLQANHALAAYLVEEKRWREAIDQLGPMLEVNDESPVLHRQMAAALEATGDLAGALEHALRAVELRPRSIPRLEDLERLLAANGHADEAREVRATIEALRR